MRLPTSKLYRAFPELDEFSSEQCRAWVRAANAGFARLILRSILFGAVFLGWLLVVSGAVYALGSGLSIVDGRTRNEGPLFVLISGGVVVGVGVGVLLVLMVRDAFLRRRVQRVMQARGSCDRCRYILVGLPVIDARVTCPECGQIRTPNEALAEVATDAAGVPRYLPSPKNVPQVRAWWTPARQRRAIRIASFGAVAAVIIAGATAGSYEVFLRWQSDRARQMRPGLGGLMAYAAANQPPEATEMDADAWDAFDAAAIRLHELATLGSMPPDSIWSDVDPAVLLRDAESDWMWSGKSGEKIRLLQVLATDMLDAGEQLGVFSETRAMTSRPRAFRRHTLPGSSPLTELTAHYLWEARYLFRSNLARMRIAQANLDLVTFSDALEQNLALLRMFRNEPIWWSWKVAERMEIALLRHLTDLLRTRPARDWVLAIRACLDRQSGGPDVMYALKAQYLTLLDVLCWLYSEPGNVRLGSHSPVTANFLRNELNVRRTPPLWIGSLSGHVTELNAALSRWTQAYGTEAWNRTAPAGPAGMSFSLVNHLSSWMIDPQTLAEWDLHVLLTRGFRVVLALEGYRIDRGKYPEALEELVPGYLDAVPVDPWSGSAMRYCLHAGPISASGYLLYSVGMDGVDDGGLVPRSHPVAGATQPGWDVIVSGEVE